MKLEEKRLDGEVLFEGRILRVERDRVELPNGKESMRELVRHPGAVAIVALKGADLLLVRQFRYAPGCELLEIPAGKLDPGEDPLACAERELREETGFRGTLQKLGTFYMTPGYTDEIIHFYWTNELVHDPLSLDEDEFLEVESIPWSKALTMAAQGEFKDGKTALGILLVQEKLK